MVGGRDEKKGSFAPAQDDGLRQDDAGKKGSFAPAQDDGLRQDDAGKKGSFANAQDDGLRQDDGFRPGSPPGGRGARHGPCCRRVR